MKVQVLIATMNIAKGDYSLLKKMNIQTDAIVCNQCDRNQFEEFEWNGHMVRWLSFREKGVGLNRNNALMRANSDIVLFADDDMVYRDNYEDLVINVFKSIEKADGIIFNIGDPTHLRAINNEVHKINRFNYLRYGTVRIAVRLPSIKLAGIYFNQCFGGGTEYCHGEDNLFLSACLNKGLKLYSSPEYIADLTEERESTWGNVSINRYLHDQGILYNQISKKYWKLLCVQDAVRRCKSYKMKWHQAYKKMIMAKN